MEQPTRETDKGPTDKSPDASRRASEGTATRNNSDNASDPHRNQIGGLAGGTMELARNLGEQAKSVAGSSVETVQDLARQAGEQASAATDVIYEQGARAGQYLTRNINEYPLMSLVIAGAIGYWIAYLVHAGSPRQGHDTNRH